MHFDIRSVSFTFSDALLRELQFCPQHIDSFNGFPIRGVFSVNSINNTDARNFAFGGCLATVDGKPVRGMFFPADVNMSSTYRELKAVFYVWKSYADRLKHQTVKVFDARWGPPFGESFFVLFQLARDLIQNIFLRVVPL